MPPKLCVHAEIGERHPQPPVAIVAAPSLKMTVGRDADVLTGYGQDKAPSTTPTSPLASGLKVDGLSMFSYNDFQRLPRAVAMQPAGFSPVCGPGC